MHVTLSPDERGTCRKALGRARRVTKVAKEAYAKAELEPMNADVQIGFIDGALTKIDMAGENEDVELIHDHRAQIRLGIRLLLSDVQQTASRELNLGIATEGSETRKDQLERLASRLGEQQELELTNETLGLPRSTQVGAPAAA